MPLLPSGISFIDIADVPALGIDICLSAGDPYIIAAASLVLSLNTGLALPFMFAGDSTIEKVLPAKGSCMSPPVGVIGATGSTGAAPAALVPAPINTPASLRILPLL